jgi:TP901 family phage tail tape measure protein
VAETVRIEIPIETVDNTDPELSKVTQNLNKMKDAADKANSSTKKAGETVSKFDKSAQKTQKSLASWAKEKYEVLLEAKDKITPVLQTIGSGLKNFGSRAWNVTLKAVDYATAPIRGVINLLKNPILQAGAVLGVSVGLADTINTYKDFEAAMSQVQAISGSTQSDLTRLTAKAKEMGATTKFTAAESAEAFNYMAMAGWNAEQMMGGIEGILNLAAASGEDLGTTSDIVTDALTAFGLKASDATHFSDVLAQASSSANTDVGMMGETFKYVASMAGSLSYSIEDVALMTGLMANSGIKSTQAGTSLNSVLTRLATNSSGAADAIAALGVNFYDSAGNARPLGTVMGELREATKGMNQEQKSNLANTVAGMEAQKGLLAILNASEDDYNKLADAISNADGASKRMSDTMMDNLSGDITLFQSAVDGLKISLGERMSNSWLRDIVQWLTAQVPKAEQLFSDAMDSAERKLDSIKRKFKDISATDEWQNADFFGKGKILWDEYIVQPFSEWWSSKGKAKMNVIAGDIGNAIGTGLTVGVATILGIDISETIDEGNTLGASFAKGFSEGFDFDAVASKLWDGLGSVVSKASKLLPGGESADLSSVLSAALLMKIATPLVGMGKGAAGLGKAIFGKGTAGTSLAGTLMGSAATGSGLLGKSAMLAIDLGAGNLAGGASMGAGALAATGMAAGAGAIAGGATLISAGIDTYKAIKSDNKAEKSAYGESAAWKAGGVAAGAAAGAAIGSIIPGLGTAVGALVGAGVGGIAGWIKGNKVKEEYQDNVEEMEKQAERAKRVYEVTGLSIDKVHFANDDLNEAMKDTNLTAEELANYINEDMAKVAQEAFGDITLSLTEIKDLAQEITFGKSIESVTEFSKATDTVSSDLASLKSTISDLKKQNWKASLGMELNETERDDYKKAIDNFAESASQYIEDNHYQATVALKLINGDGADTTGLDNMYSGMKTQIDDLTAQLSDKVTIALQDGVIQLDEQDEILNLQQQIQDITSKLSSAQEEASLDVLKIKYGSGAGLTYDSFTQMQEELKAQVQSWSENYDSALEITLTNLKLQLSEGAISQEDYDAAVQEATQNYTAQMNEMNVRVQSFNLDTIAEAWDTQLNGILPDLEGSLSEKLQTAMNAALLEKPDVSAWTQEDVMKWFDLDGIDTSAFENIYAELKATAEQAPQGVKDEIIQNYKDSIPTAEEIKEAIDWDSLTNEDWSELMESITGPIEGESIGLNSEDMKKKMSDYYGEYFESVKTSYSEALHNALEEANSEDTLNSFMEQYMPDVSSIDFIGPYSQAIYDQLSTLDLSKADMEALKTSLSDGVATAIEGADMDKVNAALDIVKGNVETSASTKFGAGYNVTMPLTVTFDYSVSNPTMPSYMFPSSSFNITPKKHAAGGYVSGGPQLSWLAEEGWGEFIIPTNPSRRADALDLYQKAGAALGVQEHAEGGYVAGSNSGSKLTDYNLFSEAIKNAPIGNYEATGDNTEDNPTVYEPVSVQPEQSGGNSISVPVNVSVSPQFVIEGSGGKSEDDIMAIIRKNMKAMADELGGEIADRLEKVFSNMPTAKEA